jgi:hypothetical protein
MKSLAKDSPVNIALQVIKYMNAGMSVVEACQAVGMPRSSFYYIIEKNPEAIADIQKIIDISIREQLVLILQHKMEILENIIQYGLSEKTSPRSRLAIYMKLTQLTDELMDSLQRDNNQDVDFLMTGPKLVKGESRFASR